MSDAAPPNYITVSTRVNALKGFFLPTPLERPGSEKKFTILWEMRIHNKERPFI